MSFSALGVCKELCEACESLNWKQPTEIQKLAIPQALKGHDIIGLAETGSGKTAAFSIPILQELLLQPFHNFALIITPTRELALQIHDQIQNLGKSIGLKSICLVGGQHMEDQVKQFRKKKFHIIVGTPGRLVDHLENTKGFNLSRIKYLVLDEADVILNEKFENHLYKLIESTPEDKKTLLFSATMTNKVDKLQRACLKEPVRLEVNKKIHTVEKLQQSFLFVPDQDKELYVAALLIGVGSEVTNHTSVIIFTATWRESSRLAAMLKLLGISAVALNGGMSQDKRQTSIDKFRSGNSNVLVATDLASRGLDIPAVDVVINYNIPEKVKTYLHRVGRTARAGRSGRAVSIVTVYSVTPFKWIEKNLGYQIPKKVVNKSELNPLREKVDSALRKAKEKIRDNDKQKKENLKKKKNQKNDPK